MHKSSLILVFLALFGSSLDQVAGQATSSKPPPLTKITNSNPVSSSPTVTSASTDVNAEAERFYKQGMELAEAGELSEAAENFQQALRLDGAYADAYSALGRTYFKMRQWQKAAENLRRASELRQAEDARLQSLTRQRRKGSSTPVTHSQEKAPQAANAVDLKTLRPQSTTTRPPQLREIASAPQKNVPQIKAADVKTPRPESSTARQPQHQEVASASLKSFPASPTKQPQAANTNPAHTKTLVPKSDTTRPPQQLQTAGNRRTNAPLPQIKRLQLFNAIADLKTLRLESSPTVPLKRLEVSSAPPMSIAAPQFKKPQSANTNAAHVKTPLPKSDTTRPSQQTQTATNGRTNVPLPQIKSLTLFGTNADLKTLRLESSPTVPLKRLEVSSAPAMSIPVPQVKTPTPANAKSDATTLRPDSGKTQASKPAADGKPKLKTDDGKALGQEQPVGNRVSMDVTPVSTPVESKTASPVSTTAPTDDSLTKIYRVGPGDVLDIRLNDSPSPNSTLFTVTPSGLLEHPTLTAPLPVTGLSVEEIGAKVEADLVKRALIDNPNVVVAVRDYASHTILVSGLVRDPGTKFLRREAIPLYVVVADAQPLPEAARVTLVRDGFKQIYEIDLMQVADMNLLVRPGDVITLSPTVMQFVYIDGEVKFPGEKKFRRGLTLTQAIMTAGVSPKSKVAQIGRDNGEGFVVALRFSLPDIASGKTADPLLKPGDRIMILR